jgi:GNAT superfamily N-acetyltransferase
MASCDVFRANAAHLDGIAVLFDGYRQFYRQPPDLDAARRFLSDRLKNDESVIFAARLAETDGLVGFTQLYPTFSSVQMRRVWTLNDLFVAESARGHGVARALMEAAREFAVSTGAVALELATELDNTVAQALYDALDYERVSDYLHFALTLK